MISGKVSRLMNDFIRMDSNGIPFEQPPIKLNPREISKVVHEINSAYHIKFEGKSFAMIRTIDLDGVYNTYYFEVRGFGDYNIFEKIPL